MKTAAKSGYHDFYHLLSGEDLPIKTQDEIHCFFDNHPGEEFVQFQSDDFCFWERVQYYHVFQDLIGRDASPLRYRQQQILEKQRKLNIQRNKNIAFQKGTHWFTISDELIKYVLSKKKWISKVFSFTLCADEIFLQTVIINSEYKKRLYYSKFDDNYRAVCRLIDWKRGEPYVYRYTDVDEIRNSPMLFARKFNCEVDREVIEYIAEKIAVNTQ